MRRAMWAVAFVVLAGACGGTPSNTPPGSPPPTQATPSGVEPVNVPSGTPPSFDEDLDPSDVPPEALIPPGTSPTNVWYAETPAGSSILVAYVEPGTDPLRLGHGLVVWRRFPGRPQPWVPVYGLADRPERGVVELQVIIGDATGDGSPDALTFENTGGSGVCGRWRVLDLVANTGVFTMKTCDTTIDLATDPVGLVVREAVFAPGDAHCCPSSTNTSVLVFDGAAGWTVVTSTEQPT